MSTKGVVAIVAVLVLLGAGVWHAYFSDMTNQWRGEQAVAGTEGTIAETSTLSPINVPVGWEVYSNEEWGIAFAYPNDWNFVVTYDPLDGSVNGFNLSKECEKIEGRICDYEISISSGGRGLRDTDWTHSKYVIDGREAKAWEAPRGGEPGLEQVISVENGRLVFHIYTMNKAISDQILSTITIP